MRETFTLAPFIISQAQVHDQGVSPGHSGVPVSNRTEMSCTGYRLP